MRNPPVMSLAARSLRRSDGSFANVATAAVGGAGMKKTRLRLWMDISELDADMERIEEGELAAPTVSAAQIVTDEGIVVSEIVLYIDEKGVL
jgi:hypothetical protein